MRPFAAVELRVWDFASWEVLQSFFGTVSIRAWGFRVYLNPEEPSFFGTYIRKL